MHHITACQYLAIARAFRASVQSKDKDRLEDLQLRLDTFRDEFDRQLLVHIVKALPGLPNTLADTYVDCIARRLDEMPERSQTDRFSLLQCLQSRQGCWDETWKKRLSPQPFYRHHLGS